MHHLGGERGIGGDPGGPGTAGARLEQDHVRPVPRDVRGEHFLVALGIGGKQAGGEPLSNANSGRQERACHAATAAAATIATAKCGLMIAVIPPPMLAAIASISAGRAPFAHAVAIASNGINVMSATCSRSPKVCIGRMSSPAATSVAKVQPPLIAVGRRMRAESQRLNAAAKNTKASTKNSPENPDTRSSHAGTR